jgi:hypothetical protein
MKQIINFFWLGYTVENHRLSGYTDEQIHAISGRSRRATILRTSAILGNKAQIAKIWIRMYLRRGVVTLIKLIFGITSENKMPNFALGDTCRPKN